MKLIKITTILVFTIIAVSIVFAVTKKPSFNAFISSVKQDAIKKGVSPKVANKYLNHLTLPKPEKESVIVHLQKHQAQKVLSFAEYRQQFLNKANIPYAQQQYKRYYTLLKGIEKKYQVPGQIIVSLWGIESDYGRDMGSFPLVRSLAVLAYHHHRSEFYKRQLIDALIMLNRPKVIPEQLISAFDGGMGQAQFEPSAYLSYAVDYNHDGFKNIWTNQADVFASIANFLHQNGWNGQQSWGMLVKLPKNFPMKQAGRDFKYTVNHWKKLGVTKMNGKPLENVKGKTAILAPNGKNGQAYLVYPNFKVLLRWNNTTFEGLSTGILSDKIIGNKRKP